MVIVDRKVLIRRIPGGLSYSAGPDSSDSLLRHLPGMLYRMSNDSHRTMQFIGDGCADLTGYRPEEILCGEPSYGSLVHKDDRDRYREVIQSAMPGSGDFEIEYRIIPKQGSVRWVLERGRAVQDSGSETLQIEGFIIDITARHADLEALARSEAAARAATGELKTSEEKYRLLARDAGCVVIALDTESRIEEWNIEAEKLYGYGREEVLGADYVSFCFPENEQESVRKDIRRAIDGTAIRGFQSVILTRSEKKRTVLWNITPRFDSDGRALGVLAIGHDRTALLAAVQAHDRTAAYARSIIDNAMDGIIIVDEKGDIEQVNKSAQRLFGYREDEILGESVLQLVPEEEQEQIRDYFESNVRSGAIGVVSYRQESTALRRQGGRVPIALSVFNIDAGGRTAVAVIVRDLTAEYAAAEALRTEHERHKATIEHAPIGIVTYRFGEAILSANAAFCDLTGYSEHELKHMTLEDLTHPDDWAQSAAFSDEAVSGTISRWSAQKRYIRKDNSIVTVGAVNTVTHDAEGNPALVIGMVENLTRRIEAESEAQEHRERMTHVVRLSMLGEMSAGIAHEINQPLTAISLFAQAGKRLYVNGDQTRTIEIFDELSRHALRAGAVVERIQAMARRQESVRQDTEVADLLREITTLAETEARVRDIVIETDVEPGVPPVNVDSVQIQQVVLNLLRNGMDAMESVDCRNGNIIRLTALREDAGHVSISVIDTGSGVSRKAEKELFTPFSTTKDNGMGMGLSISRVIVTGHGGQLTYSNNKKNGATFTFSLPCFSEVNDE